MDLMINIISAKLFPACMRPFVCCQCNIPSLFAEECIAEECI